MQKLAAILLTLLSVHTHAQKQANIWFFGNKAGLDFSNGAPFPLNKGQINTNEGVASICDENGTLLFYTEGTTVWNSLHQVMLNGTGLFGNFSSSQSAIIVPFIDDETRYYIFTVDAQGGPKGLCYSIVNMTLDNGKGAIELKNQNLLTPVCEKITAVKHCNGRDIWVITHAWNSDKYYAYLVTASGISPAPVISASGLVLTGPIIQTIGYLKVSPDGTKLAAAHQRVGVDLLDFNSSTGEISNRRPLFLPAENYMLPYGVEFSSNSRVLYTTVAVFEQAIPTTHNLLLQYDLSQPTMSDIIASKKIIFAIDMPLQMLSCLQMAPDGKMYMAVLGAGVLPVINKPNLLDVACDFQLAGVQLSPNTNSTFGLPTFIQSYWQPSFDFTGACAGLQLQFISERPPNVNTVKWDFGDPASGVNNTATTDNPQHLFSAPGMYTVSLIRFSACGNDTVRKQVQAGEIMASLGKDTTFCGTTYHLEPAVSGTGLNYLWQDNSTNAYFDATQSGLYWVEVTNPLNGCRKRDSIEIVMKPAPQFSLGPDVVKCSGETYQLDATVGGAAYAWSTGAITPAVDITQTGIYWVDVDLNGCIQRDSMEAIFHPLPVVQLGKDTTLCEEQPLVLDVTNSNATYLWQDGSTNAVYTVTSAGQYSVTVKRQQCEAKDTINVSYDLKPKFSLGADRSICSGNSVILDAGNISGTYLWQDGASSKFFKVTQSGLYRLTISNDCGSATDDIIISKGVCELYIPNAFSPNGDGLNDIFKAGFGENITGFHMQIFNRYGQLIFESRDKNRGWNGTYKGIPQDNGTYVWQIHYTTATNKNIQVLQGTVLLVQ